MIAEVWDSDAVLSSVSNQRIDYIICGFELAPLSGPQLAQKVRAGPLSTTYPAVILLARDPSDEQLMNAISAGVAGVVSRRHARAELSLALSSIDRGDLYLSSTFTTQLLTYFALVPHVAARAATERKLHHRLRYLTERELSVLRLIAAGRSTTEIAEELHLASATVKVYTSHVFEKLGVRDRLQAALVAFRCGLGSHDVLDGFGQ